MQFTFAHICFELFECISHRNKNCIFVNVFFLYFPTKQFSRNNKLHGIGLIYLSMSFYIVWKIRMGSFWPHIQKWEGGGVEIKVSENHFFFTLQIVCISYVLLSFSFCFGTLSPIPFPPFGSSNAFMEKQVSMSLLFFKMKRKCLLRGF